MKKLFYLSVALSLFLTQGLNGQTTATLIKKVEAQPGKLIIPYSKYKLPNGLNTVIGEKGSFLSGGEQQRIGIARALFKKPEILVLDEATSSLDGETEASVAKAIQELNGKITVVIIAHRLSTIVNSDLVIYLENGKLIAKGTFNEVRNQVSDFDKQAKLMGL